MVIRTAPAAPRPALFYLPRYPLQAVASVAGVRPRRLEVRIVGGWRLKAGGWRLETGVSKRRVRWLDGCLHADGIPFSIAAFAPFLFFPIFLLVGDGETRHRCVIVPCPAQLRQQPVAKTCRRRLRRRTS